MRTKNQDCSNVDTEMREINVDASIEQETDRWWENSISDEFPVKSVINQGKKAIAYIGAPHPGYTIETDLLYGQLHGLSFIKLPNGTIIAKVTFVEGVAEGFCTLYYNNGALLFYGYMEKGYRQGIGKEYNRDGKVVYDGYYEHGKKLNLVAMDRMKGYWVERDEKNEIKSISKRDKLGKFHGICYEYGEGKINRVCSWDHGEKVSTIKIFDNNEMMEYKNGVKVYQGGFANSVYSGYQRSGYGVEYDPKTRNIVYKGNFLNNERHGEGRSFKNSEVIYQGMWVHGKRKGVYYVVNILAILSGLVVVALSLVLFYKYFYIGITLLLIYCVLLWLDWRAKNNSSSLVVKEAGDLKKLNSKVLELIVLSNSCSEIVELDLREGTGLRSIVIGDECFEHVRRVSIYGLPKLKKLKIGKGSFTEKRNNYGRNKGKSFFLDDCKKLETIEIGEGSFSDFGGDFIMTNVPSLQTLVVGALDLESFNFFGCDLVLRGVQFIMGLTK